MSKSKKPKFYGLTFDLALMPLGNTFDESDEIAHGITSMDGPDIPMILSYESLMKLKKRLDLLIIAHETR